MTTPPKSEPPNEPPSREAVEAALLDAAMRPNRLHWCALGMFSSKKGDYVTIEDHAILAIEVRRLRAECEEAQGLVRALKAMYECSDERKKQLRALVDELTAPEPSRGMPLCAADFDLMESIGGTVTVASKQIKPGPDKPVTEPDLYCGACGQPSAQSLWFSGSHTAVCPLCAAEFVCNAGRVDTTK